LRWPDGLSLDGNTLYIASSALHLKFSGKSIPDHSPYHICTLDISDIDSRTLVTRSSQEWHASNRKVSDNKLHRSSSLPAPFSNDKQQNAEQNSQRNVLIDEDAVHDEDDSSRHEQQVPSTPLADVKLHGRYGEL
jgi:hypothetical protein